MEQGFLTEKKKISSIKHYETDTLKDLYMYNMGNVILQVTQNCNLRCEYCVYSGSYINRVHTNKRMSFETAVKTIDFLAAHSLNCNEVSIGFYGGEPLLNMKLIQETIAYIESLHIDNLRFSYNMTTNAMLLGRYMDYLVEKDFTLLISLDGDEYQSGYRVDKHGKSSFTHVVGNIQKLKDTYPEDRKSVV